MNITKMGNRLAGLTAATLLLAGIGLVGLTSGAGAAVNKGSDPAAGPATAAVQAPGITIAGTWNLTTDWGCDGSITGSFSQTFNADGTWTSSPFVHSGRWFQVGGVIAWTYSDTPNLVYAGNVSGSWISGVQGYETAGGIKGCFGGRLQGVAVAEEPAKGSDPALGR
ncbi:MAG TPA: hypothetical protein DGT23_32575 [Micromonosporaceae bacterium]|nr:hypothetical protein [Micromonosporaceae bacterium]